MYGVIFLFKWISTNSRGSEPEDGSFQPEASENMFFAQQTIQNACGTQALLSVLLNIPDVEIGPDLREFKEFTVGLPAEVRALFKINDFIEQINKIINFITNLCP